MLQLLALDYCEWEGTGYSRMFCSHLLDPNCSIYYCCVSGSWPISFHLWVSCQTVFKNSSICGGAFGRRHQYVRSTNWALPYYGCLLTLIQKKTNKPGLHLRTEHLQDCLPRWVVTVLLWALVVTNLLGWYNVCVFSFYIWVWMTEMRYVLVFTMSLTTSYWTHPFTLPA